MDTIQGMIGIPLPPMVANPKRIERVVRKRSRIERPKGLVTESLFPNFLPIEVQLSREHLSALREEINTAEDVLSNVYEDITIFRERQAVLNEITYSLLRIRECVDSLSMSRSKRTLIKNEIDLLTDQIEQLSNVEFLGKIPILKPIRRLVQVQAEDRKSNQADIVFVLDRNPEMKKDVLHLAKNLYLFANVLKNRGVDFRFGAQTFDRTSQPSGSMRDEVEAFIPDLNAIFFNGNTKNTLQAIRDALAEQNFREGAQKYVIVVSDGDPSDDYGDALERTIEAVNEAGAVVFALGSRELFTKMPYPAYERLSASSGGVFIDINKSQYAENMAALATLIADSMVKNGSSYVETGDRFIQVGPESSDDVLVSFPDFRPGTLGLLNMPLENENDIVAALKSIDSAVGQIANDRAEKGLLQKYLHRIIGVFDEIRLFKLDFHI